MVEFSDALIALRTALEEPYCDDCGGTDPECPLKRTEEFVCSTGLCRYRRPLSDEEISDLWCKVSNTDFVTADTHEFARAIEAAHGIKQEDV